ncbi:MAG: DUF3179 domain-containing (seleno)protein, partial [Thermoanaerobaculia bacterium]
MRRLLFPLLLLSLTAAGCAAGAAKAPAAKPGVPRIAPLEPTSLVRAKAAAHLSPDEPVLGVEIGGDARAYPLRLLDGPGVVNDSFSGVHVAVAWCRSCGSAAAYRTDAPQGTLALAATGRFQDGDQLLVDGAGTLWKQLTGAPLEGPAAGSPPLQAVPLVLTPWKNWVAAHPEARVLSPEADGPAASEPAAGPWVYGLVAGGAARAYPLERLAREGVVNDELGGVPVVLVAEAGADPQGRTIRAYERGDRVFSRSGRTVFGL